MAGPVAQHAITRVSRLKLFWALSRTPHGLLDMCTPAFAALLWLGEFPSLPVTLIGLLTTFAGYTAVYAWNDVIDYRLDREKAAAGVFPAAGGDLDGMIVRHPMAHELLSFREGLIWAGFWSVVALIGAFILNPVCVVIFLSGCALEAIYCRLWRVSPYRALVSGAVKTSGALAAVFAVDPQPSTIFVTALFFMLFFWEIGGQNIPNDLTDIEEDRRMQARTIPVQFGYQRAVAVALAAVIAAVLISLLAFGLGGLAHGGRLSLLPLAAGGGLLVWPALQLYRRPGRARAMALFNRASYYPAALLAGVLAALLV